MKKLLVLLLALVAIACNSCGATQPSPAPMPAWDGGSGPPAPVFDAAPPPAPVPGDDCGQAEANALAHHCILPTTTKGTPWATICRAYTANGVDMHTSCVVKAPDCPTVTACLSH